MMRIGHRHIRGSASIASAMLPPLPDLPPGAELGTHTAVYLLEAAERLRASDRHAWIASSATNASSPQKMGKLIARAARLASRRGVEPGIEQSPAFLLLDDERTIRLLVIAHTPALRLAVEKNAGQFRLEGGPSYAHSDFPFDVTKLGNAAIALEMTGLETVEEMATALMGYRTPEIERLEDGGGPVLDLR